MSNIDLTILEQDAFRHTVNIRNIVSGKEDSYYKNTIEEERKMLDQYKKSAVNQ